MLRTGLFHPAVGVLLCLLAIFLVAPAAAQSPGDERRVALVVGNFNYEHVPRLANSGNDATLIAAALRQLGFTVVGGGAQENVDKAQFDRLVQDFGRAIQGADVALFYYAGHGMQVDGVNWLVPADANPTRPQDLEFEMVNAELVLKQMDGAGARLNLVILDACRNNPFAALSTRAVQGGLAEMRAPEGTMISFATQPGSVAADGSGADGPFASALASSMHQPGLDIFRVFNRVGLTVKRETNGAQLPWVSSSPIDGEFYFTPTDATLDVAAAAASEPPPPAATGSTPQAGSAAAATGAAPAKNPAPADLHASNNLGTLRSLADQGKPDAEFDLGLAYAKGHGVPRDDTAARHWFGLAAAQGAAKAEYWSGVMLERGRGGPRSYAEALQWYQRAAEQAYAPAEVAMGRFYGRGLGVERDLEQRTEWYRRAADHGNAVGQWALGNFYQFGNGVEKNSPLALQWYERAADQGFVLAELRLGVIYERGKIVPKDYAASLRWFRLAADAGNPVALNGVGTFYRRGLAVPQDYAQAMRYYRKAAEKGNATAEFNIGLLYANGHGVKTDPQQARAWFEKAAAAGNQSAIDRLAKLDANCPKAGSAGDATTAPSTSATGPACQNQ